MKKNDILETAARLFAENGYARTSTSVLAKEAGVAEGTIFRHFQSKEEIFITLILRLRENIDSELAKVIEGEKGKPGLEQLLNIIQASHGFVNNNRTDFGLLLRDAPGCYGDPESKPYAQVRLIFGILQSCFQNAIELGQNDGTIRKDLNPADTAMIITSTMVGIMRTVYLGFLKPSTDLLQNYVYATRAMLEAKN